MCVANLHNSFEYFLYGFLRGRGEKQLPKFIVVQINLKKPSF